MNLILFAVLALGGDQGGAQVMASPEYADCEECVGGHGGHHGLHHGHHAHRWGPMPQTCYEPPYGCYHGSRWNNRYPAFHGTFYRKAYNYRNYFDYPWHAEMHEPTSQWSFHVTGDTGAPAPMPVPPAAEEPAPPQPMPSPAALELPLHREVRASLQDTDGAELIPVNKLRTLRR